LRAATILDLGLDLTDQQGKARMVQVKKPLNARWAPILVAACSLAAICMLCTGPYSLFTGHEVREPQGVMRRASFDDPIYKYQDEKYRPQETASGWWRWLPCLIFDVKAE
jgi:hypothetical protein